VRVGNGTGLRDRSQLAVAVLGNDATKLRMIAKVIYPPDQAFDDLGRLLLGVPLGEPDVEASSA
jgi:hypothetical protein